MSGPNGQSHDGIVPVIPAGGFVPPTRLQFSRDEINELIAALEVPFDPWLIEWRVINTTKNGPPTRGQVVPYADHRAYIDRLNAVFTPAGWTRKYSVQTSASFERSKDHKIVVKVMLTCQVTVFGLGSHLATGEEWADDDNAVTSAEAQAFKRACACLGLGRYLYYFTGTWMDLDDHKRPKTIPQLAGWATPEGWLRGLRPNCVSDRGRSRPTSGVNGNARPNGNSATGVSDIVGDIEQMERVVGKRMYRGLLKSVARVWNPRHIQNVATREKVLAHMKAAERGLLRAKAARE
jgi:Rad52/22 family double-strand break repair protein